MHDQHTDTREKFDWESFNLFSLSLHCQLLKFEPKVQRRQQRPR